MVTNSLKIQFLHSIDEIAANEWNALVPTGYPFIRHEFLATLEHSGCTGHNTDWQTDHLIAINAEGELVACMPLYLKTDSMGEYVFDWSWADAYRQYGLHYYPKLVTAIPFTPSQGPRICFREDYQHCLAEVVDAVKTHAKEKQASSWHLLFPDKGLSEAAQAQGLSQRLGCQYQWFNHNYENFDDFLATFSSRKRKNIRKERQRIVDAGISFTQLGGEQIEPHHWSVFFQFYQSTYLVRGRHPYLNQEFFSRLGELMPENLLLVLASKDDEYIAGALSFIGDDTLYGRYWGCSEAWQFLHFETCYYQGLDYAIAHKLQRFDSGAQGEHKIQRGFVPVCTWSNHWIAHEGFRPAIDNFLLDEKKYINAYIQNASEYLPFKKTLDLGSNNDKLVANKIKS